MGHHVHRSLSGLETRDFDGSGPQFNIREISPETRPGYRPPDQPLPRLAGTNRVDRVPGHPDPAGAEHPRGRHHPAAGQQVARRNEPGVRRNRSHHARMTERVSAGLVRVDAVAFGQLDGEPLRSGQADEGVGVRADDLAPVLPALARRLDGTRPRAHTKVFSSLTLIGQCRYSIAGYDSAQVREASRSFSAASSATAAAQPRRGR